MRAIVIYDATKSMSRVTEAIADALRASDVAVDLHEATTDQRGPFSLAAYDLICVGSSVTSFFGGQISDVVQQTLRLASRLEGKPVAAYVTPSLFGASRALKRLMAALEQQGALVQDFAALRSAQEATAFGKRLAALLRGN